MRAGGGGGLTSQEQQANHGNELLLVNGFAFIAHTQAAVTALDAVFLRRIAAETKATGNAVTRRR